MCLTLFIMPRFFEDYMGKWFWEWHLLKFTGKKKPGIITMPQRSKIKTAKIQCISQLKKYSFKSLLLNFESIGISYGSEIKEDHLSRHCKFTQIFEVELNRHQCSSYSFIYSEWHPSHSDRISPHKIWPCKFSVMVRYVLFWQYRRLRKERTADLHVLRNMAINDNISLTLDT